MILFTQVPQHELLHLSFLTPDLDSGNICPACPKVFYDNFPNSLQRIYQCLVKILFILCLALYILVQKVNCDFNVILYTR